MGILKTTDNYQHGIIDLRFEEKTIGKLTVLKNLDNYHYSTILEFDEKFGKKGFTIIGGDKLKRRIEYKISHWDLSALELERIGEKDFRLKSG
jgi:hypothetical protein